MTTPPTDRTRRHRPTRRTGILIAGGVIVLAIAGTSANPLVTLVSGRSIGTLMSERDGRLVYHRYPDPAAAPSGLLPAWFPERATSVTIVQPGPASGLRDLARVDADVPSTVRLPDSCTAAAGWSMPFSQPGSWPAFTRSELRTCGEWTVAERPGHIYAWGPTATIPSTS